MVLNGRQNGAAQAVAVPRSAGVTIMELREAMCRFPLGDPTSPEFRFCGAQASLGLPYCSHHAQIAYQPAAEWKRLRTWAMEVQLAVLYGPWGQSEGDDKRADPVTWTKTGQIGWLGFRPEGGCSIQDDGMWSVLSGRRHREGAALTHYAALDVSLEETAICVVDGTGRIVREMRVPLAILSGDMDAIVDARDHPCRLHQQVAHSTLTLLPGLGHMIHYSARPQIGRAVDGLMGLASTGPSPPKSASPRAFASRGGLRL